MRRKPHVLKVLQGTDQPCRRRPEPEFPVATNGDPPEWLNDPEAVKEWRRIVGLLMPTRVLTEGDLTILGHMCNLHADCVASWGSKKDRPTAAYLTQLRVMYEAFGLTPASRSKAGTVGEADTGNPFAKLGAG